MASSSSIINFNRLTPTPDTKLQTTPLPRSSHGISAIKDGTRLVLYGGENIARTPINDPGQLLWIAEKSSTSSSDNDGDGSSWKWTSPLGKLCHPVTAPSSRVAHAQAAIGDDVYIFGGRSGIDMGEGALGDMWKLELVDVDGDNSKLTSCMVCGAATSCKVKWTEVTPVNDTNDFPEPRSFHKMIAIGSDLIVFGGCSAKGRLNDMWKFDTIANKWTSLGSSHLLRGRGGPTILALSQDKIAIVAGFAGEETNDGHIYNLAKNKWEERGMDLTDMRKRSVCAFGSLPQQNKCLIFGGEVDPSHRGHEGAGNFERDLVVLDQSNGALLETIKRKDDDSSWPSARGWADAAVSGDKLFLFGGLAGDDKAPVRLDDLWECTVSNI